jgi:transcriptional regulator with XRE-family HTH domain
VPKRSHPILKRLGNRVRELRNAKGWSQEEFSDICKIDRSYMSGIERGVRNISVLHLAKLAKGLGIPVSALFSE